jgi:hypothetical protein
VIAAALLVPAAAQAAGTSIQPLPITSSSAPFGAIVAHSAPGVTEREYVLRGHARTFTDSGPTGQKPAYATRVLVRRPAHFNGQVVVELLNNSAGFEVEPIWDYTHSQLARRGIAWAGVTYDPAAIGFLQGWNKRYAALGGGLANPSQVWDIVAQLGGLIRDDKRGDNPLGHQRVRRQLLSGYSGPAPSVAAWANHFGRTGSSPYDGYLIGASFGSVASLSASGQAPGKISHALTDPVIRLDTETELLETRGATRQADATHLRTWEIAGGSHIDKALAHRFDEMLGRDLGAPRISTLCTNPLNPLSVGDASDAAVADLFRWAAGGRAAPMANRLKLNAAGDVVRDADGNARGGLRLPGIAVPTGMLGPTNVPANTSDLAQGYCPLIGSFKSFGAARLAALYPSNSVYVRHVSDRAQTLQRAGFLVRRDAARLTREAKRSGIGG